MKNNFKKFKKTPLFLSVIFLLSALVVFIFLYKTIEQNRKASVETEAAWEAEANRRDQIQALDRLLSELSGERTMFEAHFIQSSDVVPFLDMVERLAPQVGASAEVSLVDIPKDNSGLVVEVRATGRFGTMYKFLTLLENSPYELEFMSVDIQKDEGGEELQENWSGNFRMKLLSFIP